MNRFVLILSMLFLAACGGKSSPPPPSVLIKTKVVKQKAPQNLLQQYQAPREPKNRTVAGLKSYIEQLRALNKRHNQDKSDITILQKEEDDVPDTETD